MDVSTLYTQLIMWTISFDLDNYLAWFGLMRTEQCNYCQCQFCGVLFLIIISTQVVVDRELFKLQSLCNCWAIKLQQGNNDQ